MSDEKHEDVLDVIQDMISGVVPPHVRNEELLLIYAKRLTKAYSRKTDDVKKIIAGISESILEHLDDNRRLELPKKCERCSEGFEVDCEYRGDPGGCNSGDPGYHPMLGKAGLRELKLREALRCSTKAIEELAEDSNEDKWYINSLVKGNLSLLDGDDDK